jgi:glycosyltransferase involved in cell wall biosynthesis
VKIGIWIPLEIKPQIGGAFSYLEKLIQGIDLNDFDETIEIYFISSSFSVYSFNKKVINLAPFSNFELLKKIASRSGISHLILRFYFKFFQFIIEKKLINQGISIIYYLKQGECILKNYPFIATNWDLGHLSTYTFPETIKSGEFERRNQFYSKVLPRALQVFVESESGKKELLNYTNIGEHKIKVLPLFAGIVTDINISHTETVQRINKLGLNFGKYFFYPAQYWAHKNHICIIKAVKKMINDNPEIKVVFCGSDKGNIDFLKNSVKEYNLIENIIFFSFLPIEDVRALYEGCISVIFASFIGPTNMPIIEALDLGIPLICSNILGHKEILGDSALYFNPLCFETLTNAMEKMLKDRQEYIEKMIIRKKNSPFSIDNSLKCMNEALSELVIVRGTWN